MNRPESPINELSISVVAPVFNEADQIEETLRSWTELLSRTEQSFEICLCDDSSTDKTRDILDQLSTELPLNISYHKVNRGAGSALRTALKSSRGKWVILIDSDGQFDLADGLRMINFVSSSQSIAAIGNRGRKADSFFPRWGSRLSSSFANLACKSSVSDFNCALKVVDGQLARSLHLRTSRYNYSTEMTAKLLFVMGSLPEVTVHHFPRKRGSSGLKLVSDGLDRFFFIAYLAIERLLIGRDVFDN
jgi:dolichol-phosphate mannosyltransferase